MPIKIETIDDVLPFASYENGINVSRRPEYTVIDYVFVNDDTFSMDGSLECRGLKFDAEGRIIARPFHKFFNIGEREQAVDIDWNKPHIVMDKLDGSMIHPCLLNGRMVFMTRNGITPQADIAFDAASANVKKFCKDIVGQGVTPIFEFTSPDNRIVLHYEDACLTLLAVRENVSGQYWTYEQLQAVARDYNLPLVRTLGHVSDAKSFVDEARALQGVEGYVVAFADGHRLKLKADNYVLRHKALSQVTLEKNVLAFIANDALDDVLPLLTDRAAEAVMRYNERLNDNIAGHVHKLQRFVEDHKGLERRDFAAQLKKSVEPGLQSVAFDILDGKDARARIMTILGKAAGSQTRVDRIRDVFGLEWDGIGFFEEP